MNNPNLILKPYFEEINQAKAPPGRFMKMSGIICVSGPKLGFSIICPNRGSSPRGLINV